MTTPLLKLASALEMIADDWDRQPTAASTPAVQDPLLAVLASELGDRWSPELAQKVAEDPSVRDLVEPFVKQALAARETPRPLGGAVEKLGGVSVRRTLDEDYADAMNHFANVIMGTR